MAFLKSFEPGVSTLTTPGHIYFIQGVDGGLIKIGWATWPELRTARMQPHCPVALRLLYSEPGNGRQERELHDRFASARRHGEWFEPVSELLEYIEARKALPEQPIYKSVEVSPYHPKAASAVNYASQDFRRKHGKNRWGS